jgi:hypothetical protein
MEYGEEIEEEEQMMSDEESKGPFLFSVLNSYIPNTGARE